MQAVLIVVALVVLIITVATVARRRPDVPIWKIMLGGGIVPKNLDDEDR